MAAPRARRVLVAHAAMCLAPILVKGKGMRRRHGIELHEQPWVPAGIRNVFRDALSGTQRLAGVYEGIAPRVVEWLNEIDADGVLDLCSGSGGPAMTLADQAESAGRRPRVRLSDLFPDVERFEQLARTAATGDVTFEAEPLDATASVRMEDFPARTILAAFHHFEPELARRVLADAARNSDGIAILEPFRRDWWHALTFAGLGPLSFIYPFIDGFTWRRFLWCTALPVIVPMFAIDSTVSVLRCYSPEELLELVDQPDCEAFDWQVGHWRYLLVFQGTYLIGQRRKE